MEWNQEKVHALVEGQHDYFSRGNTLDVHWRLEQLKKLKSAVLLHEREISEALTLDLGRTPTEGYLCDIGSVIMEINEAIAGVHRWARPETHFTGMVGFPSVITKVYPMPYGVSLIISPFNFPFMLSLGVLAAAIAGGNCAVIKASSKSVHSTEVLKKLIAQCFPPEYITVVDGGHEVADFCLKERFDKIFYTGSPKVGRHVLSMAADNLTPVALELGGETGNWCIIRKDADIKDAAQKIAFFKILNSGQVCININQVAVAKEVASEFIEELKHQFCKQIGEHAESNPEYTRLITKAAYDKCVNECEQYRDRVVYGGTSNPENLKFSPTIIYPVTMEESIVNHELFCPLLPVIPYEDDQIDTVLQTVAAREHGLALYLFTKDLRWAEKVMQSQQYGGGCVNEVCIHLMVKGVPFNGVGHSGMGAYHGKWGFLEFTHPSSVLYGCNKFNLPLRVHPYEGSKNAYKLKALKLFER